MRATETVVYVDGIPDEEAIVIKTLRQVAPGLVLVAISANGLGDSGIDYPRRPRLVIIDMEAWPGDPASAWHAITGEDSLSKAPVVFLVPEGHESMSDDCYHAGAKSVLVKPSDPDRLAEVIRTIGRFWLIVNLLPGDTV